MKKKATKKQIPEHLPKIIKKKNKRYIEYNGQRRKLISTDSDETILKLLLHVLLKLLNKKRRKAKKTDKKDKNNLLSNVPGVTSKGSAFNTAITPAEFFSLLYGLQNRNVQNPIRIIQPEIKEANTPKQITAPPTIPLIKDKEEDDLDAEQIYYRRQKEQSANVSKFISSLQNQMDLLATQIRESKEDKAKISKEYDKKEKELKKAFKEVEKLNRRDRDVTTKGYLKDLPTEDFRNIIKNYGYYVGKSKAVGAKHNKSIYSIGKKGRIILKKQSQIVDELSNDVTSTGVDVLEDIYSKYVEPTLFVEKEDESDTDKSIPNPYDSDDVFKAFKESDDDTQSEIDIEDTSGPSSSTQKPPPKKKKTKTQKQDSGYTTAQDQGNDADVEDDIDPAKASLQSAVSSASGKLKDKALWNYEIEEIMKNEPKFKGVYALDQINHFKPNFKEKQFGIILNTVPAGLESGHWVAVFYDLNKNHICYYDSLTEDINESMLRNILLIGKIMKPNTEWQLKINRIRSQKNTTNTCGWFSINFLKKMFSGQNFKQATGFDIFEKILDNSNKGEEEIKKFKNIIMDFEHIKL